MQRILVLAAAGLALSAQSPKVKASVSVRQKAWEWKEPADFRASEREAFRIPLFQRRDRPSNRVPGAVVEVWGDASWARQDAFKAFTRANLPAFRSAFDVGISASVGGAMLADLMSSPQDLHKAPLIWSPVWFNATDPWARDRRFYR